jgi:transcription elongation factor GreB
MPRNSAIVLDNIAQIDAIEYRTARKWGDMGRYRAPRPPSAKYITPEGAARLRRELDELWRVKRPAVTRAVAEAAAQGDRSENAEYIYGKKQLAEIDRRVRFLRKRLTDIRVVDQLPGDTSRVFFGAWFELADDDGRPSEYRLVGPDEIDVAPDYVSVDSPLGRAVLGKALGVQIVVPTPDGERRYEVTGVRYR